MNIFSKVTLQSLKKNKMRTIVTIIGIMLSTALICAVFTSFSSAIAFTRKEMIYYSGNWHATAKDLTEDKYNLIMNSDEVDEAAQVQYHGYAKFDNKEYGNDYLYVIGMGEGLAELTAVRAVSGRLPENPTELVIPSNFSESTGSEYKVGDKITLELGTRMCEGRILGQDDEQYITSDEADEQTPVYEELVVKETRTYTIVGKYESDTMRGTYWAPGCNVLTAADNDFVPGDYGMSVYFRMKNPRDIFDFTEDNKLYCSRNDDLLMTYGATQHEGVFALIGSILAIIIGLIMFGAVALIYNAFAISVSERTKQFGLLSSIGATKKQLRRSVLFEAFAVSVIGIPLGILLGIAGIGVTLNLIGDKFASLTNFEGATEMSMELVVTPLAIICAVAVALVTVLISAYVPSKRASKVSAVEAIRQSNDVKAGKKHIKTPKIIYKLFGLSGMLAHKYFKRSKKRYRATIVSLFMSIVLFVSASAFTNNLVNSVETSYDTQNYDISLSVYADSLVNTDEDKLLELIKNDKNTKEAYYREHFGTTSGIDEKYLTDLGKKRVDRSGFYDKNDIYTGIIFINDIEYIKLLDKYNLDHDEYMNPEEFKGIALDGVKNYDPVEEKYVSGQILSGNECEYTIYQTKMIEGYYFSHILWDTEIAVYNAADGDEIKEVPLDEALIRNVAKSGITLTDESFYKSGYNDLNLLFPYSMYDEFFEKYSTPERFEHYNKYKNIQYVMTSNDHKASYKAISDILESCGIESYDMYNYAEEVEATRNIMLIVKVFAYGFIVLISLIAAANVFNTISTNVSLRKREFAMLRSVGMTNKGIWKMLNFECIIYGLKALVYGLPVSGAVCWLIHKSFGNVYDIGFTLPWNAIIISVCSIFLVVFSTMLYAMSRIRKDNPIDALKNENI